MTAINMSGGPSPKASFSLQKTLPSLAFLGLGIAMMAFVVFAAASSYLAYRHSGTLDEKNLEAAVVLEGRNAAHHNRLGRYLFFSSQDAPRALQHYQRAVELNPYEARYWLDMAVAWRGLGRTADEKTSVRGALIHDPRTPDVIWEAANFDLTRGDTTTALRAFKTVIENDPTLATRALVLSLQASPDIQSILDNALPATAEAHLQLLQLLMARNEAASAARVWEDLVALKTPLPDTESLHFVDFFLAREKAGDARRIWQQIIERSPGMSAYQTSSDNLVVNPGFEQDILNGGFDWRYAAAPEITVTVDQASGHTGQRSLLLTYLGSREDSGWLQYIPVKPGAHYKLSGFTKAESLRSASLPRIAVTDDANKLTLWLSGEVSDSSAWQEVRGNFVAGPATALVTLRIVRRPAEPVVRGRLWLDDFRIAEVLH